MNKLMFTALFSAGLLVGCNNMAPKRDPLYAPAMPVVQKEPPTGNGAIYQAGHGMTWFEDLRARRVGDLLTVRLVEKTSGSKVAETAADKTSSTTVGVPNVLGMSPDKLSASMSSTHAFDGSGDSKQSNSLSGEITVTVVEVLPNGNMMIRGEKRIGINQGNEYVKISGIVQPQDIDANNTVPSTKIADPTIVYVGDGPVSESNSMGWLARFFIGALMPF
ncbi:flagellar basal body L-ring protein FlgH [Magnetovirga frankeli]|jgi:flagellar L-ring protein precursor FlgH|uniref:flagellar basal body L-ring protein FlgH n=1 Tax=Magnetovirga frankeli TaxID=947516 RepID=UPI001293D5EC|nr:flagellar basal body L-ring protein FlgH [gamma proteobacterium SS-5]